VINAGRGTFCTPGAPYWIARYGQWSAWSGQSVEDAIERLRGIVGNVPALIWSGPCPA
jgi:hypothetical protein